jgi:hypothetical protein
MHEFVTSDLGLTPIGSENRDFATDDSGIDQSRGATAGLP